MKKTFATVLSGTLFAGIGGGPVNAADAVRYQSPDARGGVRIGFLDCTFGGGVGYLLGSAKEINCIFRSSQRGDRSEPYSGEIRKFGVDLGFTTRGRVHRAGFPIPLVVRTKQVSSQTLTRFARRHCSAHFMQPGC